MYVFMEMSAFVLRAFQTLIEIILNLGISSEINTEIYGIDQWHEF